MKPSALAGFALIFGAAAWAQSASTTYLRDLNGNRVPGQSFSSTDGEHTERFQSINGRQVPLEDTVERVIREDANGKTTERIVRKFDRDGKLSSTERIVTEESKQPGGVSSVRSTTYRSDLNGAMREAERQTTETRVQGSQTTTNTTIDRPTLNGSFQTVEKRSELTEGAADHQSGTESVYRRDPSGGFQEALRYVTTTSKSGDTTSETRADYEPGINGQLQLASQSDSITTKRPDGTEVTQTNLFAQTVAGRLQEASAPMRVKEQEIIERRTNPDGSVVETFSVRRPSISDPNRLGDLQKLSETVCKGKCQPEAKPAQPSPPAAKP